MHMKHSLNDGLRMAGHLLLHHETTGTFARDHYGNGVHPTENPQATSFCAIGATRAVAKVISLCPYNLRAALHGYGFIGAEEFDESPASERKEFALRLTRIEAP